MLDKIIFFIEKRKKITNFWSTPVIISETFFATHKYSCNFEYEWAIYSDSFVLSTILIYKYRLQWVCVQRCHQTHSNRVSYAWLLIQIYKFRKIIKILINDSNNSSKFTVLVVVAFTKKKEERKRQKLQAKLTQNFLVSIVAFVRESYLFCASCKC